MRHPIEKYNQQQAETLASLPEEKREWMARMFRIGNATYCYYNRAKELAVFGQANGQLDSEPIASSEDLLDWLERQLVQQSESRSALELLQIYFDEFLEGLQHEGLRRTMIREGLDKAKNSFPFRRYVLERHDIGMDEFLRLNLSAEDYAYHRSAGAVECGKPLKGNDESAQ